MATAQSPRDGTVQVEFVTPSGDEGESHLNPGTEVELMADYDFEEEEW